MKENINPLSDYMFKQMFMGKDTYLLESLISSLGKIPIEATKDLTIQDSTIRGDSSSHKSIICDLKILLKCNTQVIIEAQMKNFKGFGDRFVYSSHKVSKSNLEKGIPYYEQNKIIYIVIMGFNHFKNKNAYSSRGIFMNDKTHEVISEKTVMHFYELNKIPKLNDGTAV